MSALATVMHVSAAKFKGSRWPKKIGERREKPRREKEGKEKKHTA